MNITRYSIAALVAAVLAGSASVRAVTSPAVQTSWNNSAGQSELQTVDFGKRPEAEMLRAAYSILAKGDHDYKGHRAIAMVEVKKAAELLHYDLGGDDQYKERQALSDERLKEARTLLVRVLRAAEVKDEEKISKLIMDAIVQIDDALAVR
jgi:hypothetical protein